MNQTDNIPKYRIRCLDVEITRKCNYKCVHCLRGEPQNVTITPEIIDTMFSQLYQLDYIAIIGGETLLELDMLQYLLESIDKYNLRTKKLSMITNGSIQNSYFIDILSAFADRDKERQISVIISDDRYHDKLQSDRTLAYYQSLNYNENQIQIDTFSNSQTVSTEKLMYIGKARKFIDENMEQLRDMKVTIYYPENSFRNHQLCIRDNTIECRINLYANGSIGLMSAEYTTQDKFAFGNIMSESLESIFNTHNATCPFLCDECYNEVICKNVATFGDTLNPPPPLEREQNKLRCVVLNKRIELAWMLRNLAKQKFPRVPMQNIIKEIPVPSIQEWDSMVTNLLSAHGMNERRAANVFLQSYQRKFPDATLEALMEMSIFKYTLQLINKTPIDKYLKILYGQDIAQTELFKKLLRIEQEYLVGVKTTPEKINVCKLIPDTYWENKNIQN